MDQYALCGSIADIAIGAGYICPSQHQKLHSALSVHVSVLGDARVLGIKAFGVVRRIHSQFV